MPGVVGGRYRVLRELGRGGMGAVYLVEHLHTGDHLALKVLYGRAGTDASALERFKREARASARIKSEHVVKVVDADSAAELGGAPYLVMELLNGIDLEKRVTTLGPIPAAEVTGILVQVARALDRAHAIGIVHRDLKPDNIFLHTRDDGVVIAKVVDFGISKHGGASDLEAAKLTHTGSIIGTPLYMAPEQAGADNAAVTGATDVWALGLIAVRLLTGAIYWQSTSLMPLLFEIVNGPVTPPSARFPALPPAFDTWFFSSCARDPGQRFGSVGAQVAALAEALGLAPGQPSGDELSRRAASRPFAASPASTTPIAAVVTENGIRGLEPAPRPPSSDRAASSPTPGFGQTNGQLTRTTVGLTQRRAGAWVSLLTSLALLAAVGLAVWRWSRVGAGPAISASTAPSTSAILAEAGVDVAPPEAITSPIAATASSAVAAGPSAKVPPRPSRGGSPPPKALPLKPFAPEAP